MSQRVNITIENHIAHVCFNRPDRHNSLDAEQFKAVANAGKALMDNRDVRVVVLSGAGPSFCSGLDYPSFMKQGPDAIQLAFQDSYAYGPANNAQTLSTIWQALPMPVIAAIHGVAFGGGCQLALGADIRIAAPDAKLSVMEIEYGLIPDMGITQSLPTLVGLDVAKELTYTGEIVSGERAAELGLVTRTAAEPLEAAMELAQKIAARSPDAIRGTKTLFNAAWHSNGAEGLQQEAAIQQGILGKKNQTEAVMAKMQKRAANFED